MAVGALWIRIRPGHRSDRTFSSCSRKSAELVTICDTLDRAVSVPTFLDYLLGLSLGLAMVSSGHRSDRRILESYIQECLDTGRVLGRLSPISAGQIIACRCVPSLSAGVRLSNE